MQLHHIFVAAMLATSIVSSTACKKTPATKKKSTPAVAGDLVSSINIKGGTIFTIRIQPAKDQNGKEVLPNKATVDQTAQVVSKRLKQLGFENVEIHGEGNSLLKVNLPSISPTKARPARKILEQLGKLQFKTVHPNSRVLADRVAADPDNEIVPGYELKVLRDTDEEGKVTTENILISRRAALDGSYVVHAQELYGPFDGKLSVELNAIGAERMFQLTKQMNHGSDRLAIVLDGVVLSAPVVQSSIGKNFEISGMADATEAKALAAALLNPLKHALLVEEERTVPPKPKD